VLILGVVILGRLGLCGIFELPSELSVILLLSVPKPCGLLDTPAHVLAITAHSGGLVATIKIEAYAVSSVVL
jgi:hypothetical protein